MKAVNTFQSVVNIYIYVYMYVHFKFCYLK